MWMYRKNLIKAHLRIKYKVKQKLHCGQMVLEVVKREVATSETWLLKTIYIFVLVYVYADKHIQGYSYMCRPETHHLRSHLFFETGFLNGLEYTKQARPVVHWSTGNHLSASLAAETRRDVPSCPSFLIRVLGVDPRFSLPSQLLSPRS